MLFESARLAFRLMALEDEDALFQIWGDAETMRFCGGTAVKETIRQIINHNRFQYEKYGNAVLVMTANGTLVGICGGKLDEDDPQHIELIIHLGKEHWHKGYATEAVQAYLAWVQAEKKATYVYATIHPDNQVSINMIKKCGFVHNGYRQFEDTGFVDEPYFELSFA